MHLEYKEQKDVGCFLNLKGNLLIKERKELEKVYWQILVPLYHIIEKIVGKASNPREVHESNLILDRVFLKLDFSLEYTVEHINKFLLMRFSVERSKPLSEVIEPPPQFVDLDPYYFSGLILLGLCLKPTCGISEVFRVKLKKNQKYKIVQIEGVQFFSPIDNQRYIPYLFPQMQIHFDPVLFATTPASLPSASCITLVCPC